ncbi:VanZ family protein [Roseovarius sp. 2305UL8-3]|uniref:VanZ family protein n=1 Tax=Roseovarius conchicola TaxID=3121636 RepID=UPI00352798BB
MSRSLPFLLTLLISVIIAYGTLTPPGEGSGLPFTDKQLHFAAFAMLVLPLSWVRPGWILWLVPLAITYGAVIELIQPFVGRSGDWDDLLADALGSLTGSVPSLLKGRYRQAR